MSRFFSMWSNNGLSNPNSPTFNEVEKDQDEGMDDHVVPDGSKDIQFITNRCAFCLFFQF